MLLPVADSGSRPTGSGRFGVGAVASGVASGAAAAVGHGLWLPDRLRRDAPSALDACGVYFGTTGGQVYASPDSGDHWSPIVRDLPAVLSVEVQTLP